MDLNERFLKTYEAFDLRDEIAMVISKTREDELDDEKHELIVKRIKQFYEMVVVLPKEDLKEVVSGFIGLEEEEIQERSEVISNRTEEEDDEEDEEDENKENERCL